MSRRVTESTERHITVRQLESTVRLAQGNSILQINFSVKKKFNLQPMRN